MTSHTRLANGAIRLFVAFLANNAIQTARELEHTQISAFLTQRRTIRTSFTFQTAAVTKQATAAVLAFSAPQDTFFAGVTFRTAIMAESANISTVFAWHPAAFAKIAVVIYTTRTTSQTDISAIAAKRHFLITRITVSYRRIAFADCRSCGSCEQECCHHHCQHQQIFE